MCVCVCVLDGSRQSVVVRRAEFSLQLAYKHSYGLRLSNLPLQIVITRTHCYTVYPEHFQT